MSIKGLIKLAVVGWIASMVVAAVAAMQAKGRIGRNTDESADEITAGAVFGPLAYRSTSQHLHGGRLETWYGGGVLDLRDATLAPDGATLDVLAVFGGGQILVPAGWRVVSSVRGLGGVSDARPAQGRPQDAPLLTIEGMVFAGGFAIMSELDENEAEWLQDLEAKQAHASRTPEPASGSNGVGPEPEMAPAG
jgi:hypothetical protein